MEVYLSLGDVIIYNKITDQCLLCSRTDGTFLTASGERLKEEWNPVLLGTIHGVIGKTQTLPGSHWKLITITEKEFVGYLPNGVEVFCIKKITAIPLTNDNIDLSILELEQPSVEVNDKPGTQIKVQQTWNNIKNSANNLANKTNATAKETKERDKMDKRLSEELLKMFNDSGSFYYSPNGDLSNTQQRLEAFGGKYNWKQTDDRFFWNKFMMKELIESQDPLASQWVLPVIQGFIQIERCFIDHLESLNNTTKGNGDTVEEEEENWDEVDSSATPKYKTAENMKEDEFDFIVISRRSRHRAGTRYKRRGVDENGNVANYVETEQIVCVLNHIVSYVQVRGSVPVYWSQPGTKYRPLPIIDKGFEESKIAFAKHFQEEFSVYKKQIIISLVELAGREKIVADSFMEHIFDFDSDKLTFVTFDFHEYCRGMKFENVSVLIGVIEELIRKMSFHWVDDSGVIAHQESVFRVNCMDCLDRTNVVQAAVARNVVLNTLRKLGRLLPDEQLPYSCSRIFNSIWANNGDAISRQYAGTAAMKGDFTRTGERKIAGVMKDGYNSANRYYLNRFRDNYRQTVIDMMLGNSIAEDLSAIASAVKSSPEEDVWTSDKEECITQLVRHSQLTLLPPDEECLGGWALVDPFSFVLSSEQPQDEDIILLLTHEAYYVARYDDEVEELSSYQRIPLQFLEKIEIGTEAFHFKNQYVFMRMHYRNEKNGGFFHTVRTIQNRSIEESKGILFSIADLFLSTSRYQSFTLKIIESKLDKKRSKSQPNIHPLTSKRTLSTSSRSSRQSYNTESSHHASNKDSLKKEHRRSRSLSELDSPTHTTAQPSVPNITVEDADSDFTRFHYRFSPNNSVKDKDGTEASTRNISEVEPKKAIVKSNSDHSISPNASSGPNPFSSKMDAFFRKTKSALGTVGPKLRDMSIGKDDSQSQSANESPKDQQQQQQQQTSEAMKVTLRRINDKFMSRAVEVKSKLPEFRNRIQNALTSSPKVQRRNRLLTEKEKERRMNCKTKIIEL